MRKVPKNNENSLDHMDINFEEVFEDTNKVHENAPPSKATQPPSDETSDSEAQNPHSLQNNANNIEPILDLDLESSSSSEDEIRESQRSPRSKIRREFEKESKRERKLTKVLEKNVKFCEKSIGREKLEGILKYLLNVVEAEKEPENEDVENFEGGYGGIFKNVQPQVSFNDLKREV